MLEQDKFLDEFFPKESESKDVLDKIVDSAESIQPKSKIETEEEATEKLKNRRERRLYERLQKEREANITLNERLKNISESQAVRENTSESDFLKAVERIYGNDTPEAREATEILKKGLQGAYLSAKEEAIRETKKFFEEQRNAEQEAIKREEDRLDSIMDSLEDEFGADFSDNQTRKGFLTLLEKVSPKDASGNIIDYADPKTVYQLFASQKEKNTRAKDLASRSINRTTGSVNEDKQQASELERYLKENGII